MSQLMALLSFCGALYLSLRVFWNDWLDTKLPLVLRCVTVFHSEKHDVLLDLLTLLMFFHSQNM